MANAPEPCQIDYSKLSPGSKEVLGQIALRLTAGWTSEEIARGFNRQPPGFRHVPPPTNATTGFTSQWINARMRTLREEMVASVDPDG